MHELPPFPSKPNQLQVLVRNATAGRTSPRSVSPNAARVKAHEINVYCNKVTALPAKSIETAGTSVRQNPTETVHRHNKSVTGCSATVSREKADRHECTSALQA
jgi:hypothetical protein